MPIPRPTPRWNIPAMGQGVSQAPNTASPNLTRQQIGKFGTPLPLPAGSPASPVHNALLKSYQLMKRGGR
jgi:hypothetical protein